MGRCLAYVLCSFIYLLEARKLTTPLHTPHSNTPHNFREARQWHGTVTCYQPDMKLRDQSLMDQWRTKGTP